MCQWKYARNAVELSTTIWYGPYVGRECDSFVDNHRLHHHNQCWTAQHWLGRRVSFVFYQWWFAGKQHFIMVTTFIFFDIQFILKLLYSIKCQTHFSNAQFFKWWWYGLRYIWLLFDLLSSNPFYVRIDYRQIQYKRLLPISTIETPHIYSCRSFSLYLNLFIFRDNLIFEYEFYVSFQAP